MSESFPESQLTSSGLFFRPASKPKPKDITLDKENETRQCKSMECDSSYIFCFK